MGTKVQATWDILDNERAAQFEGPRLPHEMEPPPPLTPVLSSHGSVFPAHRHRACRVTADRFRATALQAINTAPHMWW
jgi:hypothetical protein